MCSGSAHEQLCDSLSELMYIVELVYKLQLWTIGSPTSLFYHIKKLKFNRLINQLSLNSRALAHYFISRVLRTICHLKELTEVLCSICFSCPILVQRAILKTCKANLGFHLLQVLPQYHLSPKRTNGSTLFNLFQLSSSSTKGNHEDLQS